MVDRLIKTEGDSLIIEAVDVKMRSYFTLKLTAEIINKSDVVCCMHPFKLQRYSPVPWPGVCMYVWPSLGR